MLRRSKEASHYSERELMELAIEELKKSKPEDGLPRPKVGVVVITKDRTIIKGYRGMKGKGDHAEFSVVDKTNEHRSFAGSIVYTTLEPCSDRKPPKVACAQRLIDAHVKEVVIGMIDPNPDINGKGKRMLLDAGIKVRMFPKDLEEEIRSLNRNFVRGFREMNHESRGTNKSMPRPTRVSRLELDKLYRRTNSVYWKININRKHIDMMSRLVEACCGIGQLVSEKKKEISGEEYISKAIAWWMTLCGKVGVKSISSMLWAKFPYVCPYCYECPHKQDICITNKKQRRTPDWTRLQTIGAKNKEKRPRTLASWQRMFAEIYPVSQAETSLGTTFARLIEELGELTTAVRMFETESEYFLSEAADLFAWLMRIPNIIDQKNQVTKQTRGKWLEQAFYQAYPGSCQDCHKAICKCEDVSPKSVNLTVQKPAAKVRATDKESMFMTADQARKFFSPRSVAKSS